MNVFVIGSEGAGKTVFVTMLSRFMVSRPKNLVFGPVDFESSNYVAKTMDLLERRRWPRSNPEGELTILKWKFGRKGKKLHQISLFDYSGQDMRKALLADDTEKLQGRPKELRKEIDNSAVLVYLLDMGGLVGGASLTDANENAWLLCAFMTRPAWCKKERLLVVTKADLYAGMISEAGGDLRKMIADHWPAVYNPDEFLSQQEKVEVLALTSVHVTTTLDGEGSPVRVPRFPLESDGFPELVEQLSALVSGGSRMDMIRKLQSSAKTAVMVAVGGTLKVAEKVTSIKEEYKSKSPR